MWRQWRIMHPTNQLSLRYTIERAIKRGYRLLLLPQLKVAIIILTVLLAGSIAAKAIGSLQSPNNPALRGFTEGCEDKPQPCWYGIIPGVTTEEEANQILEKLTYGKSVNIEHMSRYAEINIIDCDIHIGAYSNLVYAISWANCDGLSLGALMNKLGDPKGVYFMCPQTQERQFYTYGYTVFYTKSNLPKLYSLSPYNEIDYVDISPDQYDQREGNPIDYKYKWISFSLHRRYKQLQPEIKGCYPSGPG